MPPPALADSVAVNPPAVAAASVSASTTLDGASTTHGRLTAAGSSTTAAPSTVAGPSDDLVGTAPSTDTTPSTAVAPSTQSAGEPSTGDGDALTDWTVEQAVSALRADDLVVLPGSSARIDELRVRELIAGTDPELKVLVLPRGPLDSEANTAYRERVREVGSTLDEEWDGELITVVGLEVDRISTTGLGSVRRILATENPTFQIESAVQAVRTGGIDNDRVEDEVTGPSDPAEVARLIAALQQNPIVTDPGAPEVGAAALARWSEDTGRGLRVVVLPPLDPGERQRVTAADLAPAFPEDQVVLFQGMWFEVAGPDQQLLTIARDMTLSSYQSFLLGRDVGPANVLGPIRNQVVDFTSGAVTGQQAPTQRNPVAWLLVILPVLALAVVVWFALRRNRSRTQDQIRLRHDGVADLAAAAALLPELAAGILALDPLARDAAEKELVGLATVRYRTARRLVEIGEDGPAALAAVRQAQQALTEAAEKLGVPHVPGTLEKEPRR